MKVHAVCPACGSRFSRWLYIRNISFVKFSCSRCGATVRNNPKWEWAGNIILGFPMGIALAGGLTGLLVWRSVIVVWVAVWSLTWCIYPYIAKFDVIAEGPDPVALIDPPDGQ